MPQKGGRSNAQKAKKAQRSSRKQKKKSKKRTSYQVNVSQVTTCEICQAENQIGEWFVACDTCGYDFHIDCVGQNNVDEGKPWFCTNCIENTSQLDTNQEENEVSEPSVINVSDVTRSNVNTSNEVEPASQEKANVDNNDQSKSINTQPFGINIPVSVHRSADAWLQDLGNDDQLVILNPSYNRKRSTSVTGISNPNQQMKGLQNGNTIATEKFDQTSIPKSTNASNAKENQSRSTPIGGTAERSTIELPGAILESNGRKSSLKSASRTSKQSASTTLQRIQDEFELQEKIDEEILSTQLEAIKRKEARYKKFLADVYDAKSHDGSVKSRASKVTSKTSYVSSWVEDQQKRSKLPDAEKSENVNKCYTNSFNVSIPVSKEELAMLRQSRIDEIRQNRIDDIFSKADKEERNKTSHSQSAKSNIGAEIIDDQMVARSYQNYTSTIVQPPVSRSTLLPKQQIISEKSTETVIESKIHNVRSGPAYPAGSYGADEIIHEEPIRDRTAFMKKKVQLSEQPTMKQTYQEMFPIYSDANVSTYRPTQQSQYHSSKPIYTSATRTQPTYSSTNNQQQYNTSEPPIYRSIGRMAYVPNSEQRYSGIGQPVEHTGNQTRAEPFDGRNTRYKIQHDQTQLTPNQIAARHAIDKTLPKFDGNSYDWPHFIKRYENSTRICGLTDDENLERLNKCLMSPAKDIVRSQLMMPECVGEIMQILFERFGRPELVMNATLAAIREEPPIKPHQLNALANYGYKVHSACNVIERLGLHYYLYNPELVQEVLAKLPHQTKIDFAVCCHKVDQITLRTLGDWLRALSQTINRIAPAEIANNSVDRKGWKEKHSSERSSNDRKQDRNTDSSKSGYLNVHDGSKTSTREESKQNCVVCDKSCKSPAECSKFKTSDVEQRWESIKTHKLCRMCLKRHTGRCKNAKDCGTNGCTFKHHAMLHNETRHSKDSTQQLKRSNKQDSKPAVTNKSDSDEGKKEVKSGSSNTHFQQEEEIFRISPVVLHYNNKSVKTYAYFDEGSSFTLLERETASQLDVRGTSETICLLWTNKVHRQEESEVVDIDISGNIYDTGEIKPTKKHHMKSVYIVDELGLPSQSLEVEKLRKRFAHLKNVPLIGYENIVPTMLIGLKHVKLTVPLEVVEGVDGEPIATRSRLGWQVYGPGGGCTKGFVNTHRVKKCPCQDRDDEIHKLVKDHFTIENFGVSSTPASTNSKEDEKALKMLQELTMRKGDRFQTGLLWKNNVYKLPDSYPMAKKRLICLENKGQKAIDTINESIEDYLQKGYVTKLSTSEADITSNRTWYLPIFTAVNPKKPEKLRTVFDAAAKVKGVSLNAVLFTGPDLLVSIVDVLRRFREHRIAINGDVKEMYHQVLINDQDRDSQRFLWRNGDKSKEPETYQMNVMTFGSTCSPSTAQYVKNLNASEFLDKYPRAVEAIIKNHYVDDMMDGTDSIEETIQLVNDVKFIHRKGGFEIRNFKSNSPEVLKAIGEPFNDEMIAVDNINLERVLGMFWETKSDCLTFSLKYTKVTTDVLIGKKLPTKRELLKLLMSIYDPLGLLSYYLIHLKILLQDVWRSDMGWDTPLPSHLKVAWKRWITILPEVEKIRIPRWYSDKLSPKVTKEVELHVFVDAGDHAYSAVAYLRIVSDEGVAVVLIGSKARVTPLKYLSIPRKELLASLLGTRLSNNIKEGLSTKIHRRIIWSDSITVLTWLHSEHQKYSQFVAHRVGEILETTELCEWRWVPSKQNVADEATKWSKTPTFESTNRWFQGPEFLQLPEPNWPQLPEKIIPNGTEEEMKLSFSHSKLIMPTVIHTKRFSVWERMLRAVAYAIRWGRIMLAKVRKLEKPKGPLTQEELLAAEKLLFRQAQWEGFTEEMITLVNNKKNPTKQKSIEKSSIIYDCQPYLDQFGVMRVKGRIDNATMLELDTRRPIILPRNNHITKLIMLSYHVCLMHQNHETAINEIKQRFYIPRIRVAFRSARWNCGACAVRRSLPRPPKMADLPSIRFEPVRAFTYAGIDYFGPIRVMVGRRVEKRWGVLITCLTIRAIHIEVVHSLDTDSCIKALRRFISLRGRPTEIYSDNGTSFKGADKELKEELKKLDVVELSSSYTSCYTKWFFNPPATPHMGGPWERLIRTVKSCLKVSMTARIPKDETLDTLLKEIMNIVNSRPLTFVPLDSCDAEALTPNHFILGSSNGLKPPGKFKNDGPYLRSAWREVQRCTNIFWQRFINEYVPTLTRRTKWFDKVKPIEVGDIVLDFDENSPRNTYRRARVVDTKIGSNEQVRRVRVQYADGKILWRSAVKLGVLDVHPAPTVDSSLDHQSMIETEGNNVGARNSNVETTSGPSGTLTSTDDMTVILEPSYN